MPIRPAGNRFALEVGGIDVGALRTFSGLDLQADIVSEAPVGGLAKKHVANFAWTSGRATVGVGMGKGMVDWIRQSFDTGSDARSGSVKVADASGRLVKSTLSFTDARITEVTVPRLDASSKDAAYFDIAFDAERVSWSTGGGGSLVQKPGAVRKSASCSNFRIEIGRLPCARVAAIESFSWQCALATDPIGIEHEPVKHPAKVTVPDLKLSISAADHAAWSDAARAWFVDGRRLEADEMTGRLVLLAADLKEELVAINLSGVGFKAFSHAPMASSSDQVERFTVTLYVEKMQFKVPALDA